MTQVVETLTHGRQESVFPIQSMPWLLMTWLLTPPGHHQPWYWPISFGPSTRRVTTLRPRQNGHHLADDIFKCIFLNENVSILIMISLNFVRKGSINIIPALVQIMAWRHPGDKPLSEPMLVSWLTHICITWPQWVNPETFCPLLVANHCHCLSQVGVKCHVLLILNLHSSKSHSLHFPKIKLINFVTTLLWFMVILLTFLIVTKETFNLSSSLHTKYGL